MTDEQFDRELKFQISVSILDMMRKKDLVTPKDYAAWREKLVQKYDPPIGRIVSN